MNWAYGIYDSQKDSRFSIMMMKRLIAKPVNIWKRTWTTIFYSSWYSYTSTQCHLFILTAFCLCSHCLKWLAYFIRMRIVWSFDVSTSVFPEMGPHVQKWMYGRARSPAFLFALTIWFRVHFMNADVHIEKHRENDRYSCLQDRIRTSILWTLYRNPSPIWI